MGVTLSTIISYENFANDDDDSLEREARTFLEKMSMSMT